MYTLVMTDMTVAQVAAACGVTERTVRRWLKEGRLAGVRVGGRVRIDARAVGELAAPYGSAVAEALVEQSGPQAAPGAAGPDWLRAVLDDPERLAVVRARRAARTMELIREVRAMATPGELDPEGIIRAVRDEQDATWDERLG